MNEIEATQKVKDLINKGFKVKSICKSLSITYPTFKRRIEDNQWNLPQLLVISKL